MISKSKESTCYEDIDSYNESLDIHYVVASCLKNPKVTLAFLLRHDSPTAISG
jgi:hypothetical protein